ncbi:MAG: glycosyltransferase family 2 protein [Pseudarcicella sp.]|nr:glycosyltransferase family 2 protein [Pseudarcicella sp.]
MTHATFTILLTTKNRKTDLAVTLAKIQPLLVCDGVECIVCDDGSTDDSAVFIQTHYPQIQLIQHKESKGLIYSRNRLLDLVTTEFAISLDDDAHFITANALSVIADYFAANPNCGVLALRIFWDLAAPHTVVTTEKPTRVQGFVGCGHVWRMKAWRIIPDYPDWFIFYGEEDFAAYQLFKNNIEIHYLPEVLVHHRVDVKARKNSSDYTLRLRRSLRSGWYLYFLFYPLRMIPRKMAYSIWMQLQLKVFKGDFKALYALILALSDLIFAVPKIIRNANRLTTEEYSIYQKLAPTRVYWKP